MKFVFVLILFTIPITSTAAEEQIAIKITSTGIWPAEGLGFSNGKRMGSFGSPTFSQTKFSRENALGGVTLQLVYP